MLVQRSQACTQNEDMQGVLQCSGCVLRLECQKTYVPRVFVICIVAMSLT